MPQYITRPRATKLAWCSLFTACMSAPLVAVKLGIDTVSKMLSVDRLKAAADSAHIVITNVTALTAFPNYPDDPFPQILTRVPVGIPNLANSQIPEGVQKLPFELADYAVIGAWVVGGAFAILSAGMVATWWYTYTKLNSSSSGYQNIPDKKDKKKKEKKPEAVDLNEDDDESEDRPRRCCRC